MILCLEAVDVSILTHRVRPFLIKSAREAFFVSFLSFYRRTFFATFYFFSSFFYLLYLESGLLSVAYLTVANLARLRISVHC